MNSSTAGWVAMPPAFPAAGDDFHQLGSSPTIDAGTVDGLLGAADLDGEARVQGTAPDIGADEAVPATTGNPAPGPSPAKKCKKKKKKKHGAAAAKKKCKKRKKHR